MVKFLNIGMLRRSKKTWSLFFAAIYLLLSLVGTFLLIQENNRFEKEAGIYAKTKTFSKSIVKIKRFLRRERVIVNNRKSLLLKLPLFSFLSFNIFLFRPLAGKLLLYIAAFRKQIAWRNKYLRYRVIRI